MYAVSSAEAKCSLYSLEVCLGVICWVDEEAADGTRRTRETHSINRTRSDVSLSEMAVHQMLIESVTRLGGTCGAMC